MRDPGRWRRPLFPCSGESTRPAAHLDPGSDTEQLLPLLAITAEGRAPAAPDSRKEQFLCKPRLMLADAQPRLHRRQGRPTLGWVS